MNKEPLYAKVDFATTSQHGWSNLRGYGVLTTSTYKDGQVITDRHMYNRLQPLTTPYGDHYPGKELQLNNQTDLAWSTKN